MSAAEMMEMAQGKYLGAFSMSEPSVGSDVAAVIGVPNADWGEIGKAFIVAQPDETVGSQELLYYLDGKLAKFKLPKQFAFIDALPMTESGKVKKAALKQQEAEKAAD